MPTPIRYLGDPVLREKCVEVKEVTPEILDIANRLLVTMKASNGLGLAAPQIGYTYRMFAICISDEIDEKGNPLDAEPMVLLNPKITKFYSKKITLHEGCISIPGFYEEVTRPEQIDIEAIDLQGNKVIEKGLCRWRSRCMQHEIDHLDGILFIDRFPPELKEKHANQLQLLEMQYRQRGKSVHNI